MFHLAEQDPEEREVHIPRKRKIYVLQDPRTAGDGDLGSGTAEVQRFDDDLSHKARDEGAEAGFRKCLCTE